jgi:hypothetical protein
MTQILDLVRGSRRIPATALLAFILGLTVPFGRMAPRVFLGIGEFLRRGNVAHLLGWLAEANS